MASDHLANETEPIHLCEENPMLRHQLCRRSFAAVLSAVVLGVCTSTAVARGGQIIPDQSNTAFTPTLFQSIQIFSPMGQEFTPTFSSLDVVELFTGAPTGAELYVNIRSGTITGPILGTSLVVPGPQFGPTEFDFLSQVPLVPGDLFVIEVVSSGMDSSISSSGGPFSTYPGGDQILQGVPQPNNDLWFVEGLAVAEPGSIVLFGLSMLALLGYRWRRGRFHFSLASSAKSRTDRSGPGARDMGLVQAPTARAEE
jgi:hypothetical protein